MRILHVDVHVSSLAATLHPHLFYEAGFRLENFLCPSGGAHVKKITAHAYARERHS